MAVALATGLAVTGAAGAAAGANRSPAPRPAQDPPDDGGQYVVAFEAGGQEAALAAVEAAGGVVLDVQEQIGLALVETAQGGFTEAVAADASVTGVVQNQSIGASEEGRAQVRATERLTAVDEEASGQGAGAQPSRTDRGRRPPAWSRSSTCSGTWR